MSGPDGRSPAGSGESAVSVRGLRKRFGTTQAVDGVELSVPAGSFFGLVGPNGAGKTTTLRMLTGLLRPDAGQIIVDGADVWADPDAAKRAVGVLPEDLALFERLTGREMVQYAGLLRGLPSDQVDVRADALLGVLGLADDAGGLIVDYSHGMQKKVALAAALVHGPRVVVLDEPFEAIDPVSVRAITGVLDAHRAAGGTVVFSSHVMEVVERRCDQVAIVAKGRVVASGATQTLCAGRRLEDVFVAAVGGHVATTEDLDWLGSSSG